MMHITDENKYWAVGADYNLLRLASCGWTRASFVHTLASSLRLNYIVYAARSKIIFGEHHPPTITLKSLAKISIKTV